jgi:putative hemolysin
MRTAARAFKIALEKLDSGIKLHHFKTRNFKSNVSFSFERDPFIVKTAENGAELEECLKLRFEVFHREFMHKNRTVGVDVDKLDDVCDHLMIIDKRSDRMIGTYRLNSSNFTDSFYSAGEFHMEKLLQLPGSKLELGRACIDKDFRNGAVISLLWRGIAEYIHRTETKYLFGCASVKTMEPLEVGSLTKYMTDKNLMAFEYEVEPTKKFKMKQLAPVLDYLESNPYEYSEDETKKLIPALFNSYLKLGAKVCGEPALDRDFRCVDFLTLVKIDEMNPLMKGKYKI